jgi:hypothetical protein
MFVVAITGPTNRLSQRGRWWKVKTTALQLLVSVSAVATQLAAQMPAVADASKVFAYDATKPLNLTIARSETRLSVSPYLKFPTILPKTGVCRDTWSFLQVKDHLRPSYTCIGDRETRASFCPRPWRWHAASRSAS